MSFIHLFYDERFAYTFMQQLPLSPLKCFKATVECSSLHGTGRQLLSYTSVFTQKTELVLGPCFVDPLHGNISFVTSAWPPSLLPIRDVIHVLQSHTVNQGSALQAGKFSRLASEEHCFSEQTPNVDATWDNLCIELRLEQIFFCQAAQT